MRNAVDPAQSRYICGAGDQHSAGRSLPRTTPARRGQAVKRPLGQLDSKIHGSRAAKEYVESSTALSRQPRHKASMLWCDREDVPIILELRVLWVTTRAAGFT